MTDDANRPKLRKRPADWSLAGFDSIVERHGRDALEASALADVLRRPPVQRTLFDGMRAAV